jgi:hypothetical protein
MKLILVSFATLTACSGVSRSEPPADMQVSALTAGNPDVAVKDVPAAQAYAALGARVSNGGLDALKLAVYELEPVPQIDAVTSRWATSFGAARPTLASAPDEHNPFVSTRAGDGADLDFNALSGAERWTNRALFHTGAGVAETSLPDAATYVRMARAHLQRTFPSIATKLPLVPYKVRYYKNVVGKQGDPSTKSETVYQIAAAFNTTVDDLPVIGPGSKAWVHMTPDGTAVAHEHSIRGISRLVAPIPSSTIVPPEEARAQVESQLRARGVDLDHYRPSRSEFGYYRRGSRSTQTLMAPYYAFFYEPTIQGWKSLEEHVPATSDPAVLSMLESDEKRELARKAVLMKTASGPDQRRN